MSDADKHGAKNYLTAYKKLGGEKARLNGLNERQALRISELEKENIRLRKKLSARNAKVEPLWPILKKDVLESNEKLVSKNKPVKAGWPLTINWVVPKVKIASGGQRDIFRTIEYLSHKGHKCRTYIYDPTEKSSLSEQTSLIHKYHPRVDSEIFYNAIDIDDCDAIFATQWTTAYRVNNFKGLGKRYYYIQDFEPALETNYSWMAEATYSFDIKGITLGSWLAETVSEKYGMECASFEFGYEPSEYYRQSKIPRSKEILFYAQPSKMRRGFELGVMALEMFKRNNPEYKIHFFGEDIRNYKIPFPFVNHGVMTVRQLNNLYNRSLAGLAVSFTNMALIPLEMLAAGCIPVVNDAPHTRKVKYSRGVMYVDTNPHKIADALAKACRSKLPSDLNIEKYGWDKINSGIEKMLLKDLS